MAQTFRNINYRPEFRMYGKFSGEEGSSAEKWLRKFESNMHDLRDVEGNMLPSDYLASIEILLHSRSSGNRTSVNFLSPPNYRPYTYPPSTISRLPSLLLRWFSQSIRLPSFPSYTPILTYPRFYIIRPYKYIPLSYIPPNHLHIPLHHSKDTAAFYGF